MLLQRFLRRKSPFRIWRICHSKARSVRPDVRYWPAIIAVAGSAHH